MKLFESFSDAGFHSCVVTTFGVDFGAYESIVLSRLREAGRSPTADQGQQGGQHLATVSADVAV